MEKTNNRERSCGNCKKFINIIGVGPMIREIRGASRGRQRPVGAAVVPAAGSAPNSNPATKIVEPSTGTDVKPGSGVTKPSSFAIKIENHMPVGSVPENTGQNGGKKVEIQGQHVESSKTGVDIDDRSAEFLKRAKGKMRTSSDVGSGKTLSRKVSSKDLFTEYINRAKNKLRTTSSIGGARNSASK